MFRKILVAVDFSKCSRAAIAAAVSLAKHGSATIEVVHVSGWNESSITTSPFVPPANSMQTELQNRLEDFFPAWLYPNSHRTVLSGIHIEEEILEFARKGSFNLIVIGSHGRDAIGRFFFGSVAQRLTCMSEIPVMVVRDVEHAEGRYHGFDRILVPTDFSDASMPALKLGVKFANFLKADLHHIHAIHIPTIQDVGGAYPFFNMMSMPVAEMNVDLTLQKNLEGEYLVGNTKVLTLIGDPVVEILSYAEEHQMNFIVMGTHGRKGFDRVLMGSVTAGIVAKSKIPVITVSPHVVMS